MKTTNPFRPNAVVMPRLFAGRAGQLMDICSKLTGLKDSAPTSFFVYGERGIGKTALAKLVLHIAKSKDLELYNLNLLTSYYSVEKGQTIASVLQESINNLTEDMEKGVLVEIGERVGGLLKNGKFQFGAFGATVNISQLDKNKEATTIKDQSVSILSNIIRSIEKLDEVKRKEGVLIVIDEIHNLVDLDTTASILRNIITTLDVGDIGKVSFLLIGYKEDMEKFFKEDSSSRRAFDTVLLESMPDEEAMEVLKKGFDSIEIKYDEKSLINNINVAGGYPHAIQILGHNLIEVDEDNNISKEDWGNAIFKTAYELRTKDFSKMYSFGKKLIIRDMILALLAKNDRPMTRKEIDDSIEPSIYQHMDGLIKCGAIKEVSDKRFVLNSSLFRTAIRIDGILRKNEEK